MENNPSLKIVLEISFLSSCIFSFEYLIPAGARYNDNIKAKFGADSDLQIFHNTSDSVINSAVLVILNYKMVEIQS